MKVEAGYLTVAEAATYAGVSKDLIYEAVSGGGLKYVPIGRGRRYRFRRQWIDAWMERHARVNLGIGAV